MCKKSNTLLSLVLVFAVFCLLSALMPASDFDNDGHLDSLVTDGCVLLAIPGTMIGVPSLLTRLSTSHLIIPQVFSPLIVHPPISTE
jgi:hypothetical protein